MKKNRLGYALVMAGCAMLLFFYSTPFFLYMLFVMAAVALGMMLLLKRDAGYLRTEFQIYKSSDREKKVSLKIRTTSAHRILAAGSMVADVVIRNEMFDTSDRRRFVLNLRNKENFFQIPLSLIQCGEIQVECVDIRICDLFRLFSFKGKKAERLNTVIYPEKVGIQVELSKNLTGSSNEDGMLQNRKGNDPSETFDIREYVPGDDLRSIHWKLSSKTDTLILREASEPTHYQVVVMPDFGLDQMSGAASLNELSCAVGTGAALCQQLVDKGIFFCVAFPTVNGLRIAEVRSSSDCQKILSMWLSLRVQKKSGDGLKFFMMEHMERNFTRLLILAAGKYEQNLNSLDGKISVTVLNASDKQKEIRISREGSCEMVEIPAIQKKDTTYRIMC